MKNATETYGMLQTAFRQSCMNQASVFEWQKRFKEGKESVRDDERYGRSRKSIHPSWLAKELGLGLGLLCWGFKGVQQEIPSEEVSGISSRTIHQSTTPSLSKTIWPRWALRPHRSYSVTKVIERLTLEDFHGAFQICWTVQVHCSRRRLLWRGLEFHVCTINNSAHAKKSL